MTSKYEHIHKREWSGILEHRSNDSSSSNLSRRNTTSRLTHERHYPLSRLVKLNVLRHRQDDVLNKIIHVRNIEKSYRQQSKRKNETNEDVSFFGTRSIRDEYLNDSRNIFTKQFEATSNTAMSSRAGCDDNETIRCIPKLSNESNVNDEDNNGDNGGEYRDNEPVFKQAHIACTNKKYVGTCKKLIMNQANESTTCNDEYDSDVAACTSQILQSQCALQSSYNCRTRAQHGNEIGCDSLQFSRHDSERYLDGRTPITDDELGLDSMMNTSERIGDDYINSQTKNSHFEQAKIKMNSSYDAPNPEAATRITRNDDDSDDDDDDDDDDDNNGDDDEDDDDDGKHDQIKLQPAQLLQYVSKRCSIPHPSSTCIAPSSALSSSAIVPAEKANIESHRCSDYFILRRNVPLGVNKRYCDCAIINAERSKHRSASFDSQTMQSSVLRKLIKPTTDTRCNPHFVPIQYVPQDKKMKVKNINLYKAERNKESSMQELNKSIKASFEVDNHYRHQSKSSIHSYWTYA